MGNIILVPIDFSEVTDLVLAEAVMLCKAIFGEYSGTKIKPNGRKYLLLAGSDILAIKE